MPDLGDLAQEQMEREQRLARMEEQRRRALAAAEQPEHDARGRRICLDCGEPIPARRLRVVPDAVRCVECQAELEARRW